MKKGMLHIWSWRGEINFAVRTAIL